MRALLLASCMVVPASLAMAGQLSAPPLRVGTTAGTAFDGAAGAAAAALAGAAVQAAGGAMTGSLTLPQLSYPSSGINFVNSASSSVVRFNGPVNGTTTESSTCYACYIFGNDSVASTATNNLINGLEVLDQLNSNSARGSRTAIFGQVRVNAAVGPGYFVSQEGDSTATVSNGGSLGSEVGVLNGSEFSASLYNANYWVNLFGEEVSTTIDANSSSQFKNDLAIELGGSDAKRGYAGDYAVSLFGRGVTGSPGWANGISFGRSDKTWSFSSDSALINAVPQSQNFSSLPPVANLGLDFSAVQFTTASLKLPGAMVDPVGNATFGNITIGRSAVGASLDANRQISTSLAITSAGAGCSVGEFLYFGSTGFASITATNSSGGVTGLSQIVPDTQVSPPTSALSTTGNYCSTYPTVAPVYVGAYELDLNPGGYGPVVVGSSLLVKNAIQTNTIQALGQVTSIIPNGSYFNGTYITAPTIVIAPSGTAGSVTATAVPGSFSYTSQVILSAGTGYTVGDVVKIICGTQTVQLKVTSISGGGSTGPVSGLSYYGGSGSNPATIPANPINSSGGTGTGLSLTVYYSVQSVAIKNGGAGYPVSPAPAVTFSAGQSPFNGTSTGIAVVSNSLALSGSAIALNGTTIAISLQAQGGPVTNQTGNYTVAQTDCGTKITDTGATAAHTYTIPTGLSIGCRIVFVQETANKLTLTNAANETVNYLPTTGSAVSGTSTAGSLSQSPLGQYGTLVIGQETSTTALLTGGNQ